MFEWEETLKLYWDLSRSETLSIRGEPVEAELNLNGEASFFRYRIVRDGDRKYVYVLMHILVVDGLICRSSEPISKVR